MELNERVICSKSDEEEFEKLLNEYRPFIASCVSKTVGKYVDEHDDEMSIATLAFREAVERYKEGNGAFLSFAGMVIKDRLIDKIRSDNRRGILLSLDCEEGKRIAESAVSQTKTIDDPVKLEIEALSERLKSYGITFSDLVKCSPKHNRTKKLCAAAANSILTNPALLSFIKEHKQMPIKSLEQNLKIPRKTLERHRNYIVSLVEILSGDYVYLAEYVKFVKEVRP